MEVKDEKIINIETIDVPNDRVTRRSEIKVNTMEELKEPNPELTPNTHFELENDDIRKGYTSAREPKKSRVDMINSKRKKAKETIGSRLQNTFGVHKKSVQQTDPGSLIKSFRASPKKQRVKSKLNQSLADYTGGKSIKKTSNYNSQSFISRPQSTRK